MNYGKVRLSENDIEVLMFLGKYKMMLGSDCKKIYKSKDYHRKRLKVLEREKYIRRINKLYIKLDDKGTKLVKDFGYDYSFLCRKKQYIGRLNEIAKIAALTIDSDMDFVASWNLKDRAMLTQTSRKYLGKLKYQQKDNIVYYISKNKQIVYISQIINDIQKIVSYKNIIIFVENMKIINKNRNFVFGKESTIIINPTSRNLEIMRRIEQIDFYYVIKEIYYNEEVLLSNWKKADYMTESGNYIIVMPFIDTEKLYRLNMFYKNNQKTNRKIDIVTLNENKEKIDEILTSKANIVAIDRWLGGMYESK